MAEAATHVNYKFYIEASTLQTDIANNRSLVRLNFSIQQTYGVSSDPAPVLWFDVRANGEYVVGSSEHGKKVTCSAMTATTAKETLYTYDLWVEHNAYGNCSLIVTTTLITATSWIDFFDGSASFTLPNIPRTSTFVLNKSSVNVGSVIIMSIDRQVPSFTHKIWWGMSGQDWVEVATGIGDSYDFEIPVDAINYIPKSENTGYLRCITCDAGGNTIGYKDETFKVVIPATQISATASVEAGETITINAPSVSNKLTHILYHVYPGQGWGRIAGGTETSFSHRVPMTALEYIPSATSGTVQIACETYNGNTYLGTSWANVTFTAPANVKPVIDSVTINEAVDKVKTAFNQYVTTLSQLNINISATGIYDSKITSYSTKVDGVNYNQAAFTTNQLQTVGTMAITTIVTDSRGRTASHTEHIEVAEYFDPKLYEVSFYHVNEEGWVTPGGPIMAIGFEGETAPVKGANKCIFEIKYRRLTDQEFTVVKTTDLVEVMGKYTFDFGYDFLDLPKDNSYEFAVTLTDKLSSVTKTVENGVTAISIFKGGRGICFFGEAKAEGIWLGNQKLYDFPTPTK